MQVRFDFVGHTDRALINAEKVQLRDALQDRRNSVMELVMAGGNYPRAEMPIPRRFLSAVQAETEGG